ncbi:antibiotic biosynthesis monooxygenase [Actinomadura decatromicini]|uniref:antibiotic biosynthesis monooxygenase n=1 Tax=Actinomadura decatromicini TaxID=2604572 RepID=UPI003CCC4B41
MAIQLTAVIDIPPTHAAEFESALTAFAEAAATEPGVLDHGIWRDATHPSPLDGGRHA